MPDTKMTLKVIFQFSGFLHCSIIIIRVRTQAQLSNRALASGETEALPSKQKPYLNERVKNQIQTPALSWCCKRHGPWGS